MPDKQSIPEQRVRITAYDPATGDTETQELDPYSYVLIAGEHTEVTRTQHLNGTTIIVVKRV